ncbi:hypothetical protein TI39_contig355g00026 [Zymoseptoria brevis]|uniref:Camp independent regulatory protein n=1 Tax=Zymoseptoria brevis TaxID=1047168 RepID=A0A0F4GQJ7_9PEZI|nr:hypothetical protein TI39_contig355g00026 [Zymoseptoria brevis]
MSGGAGPLVPTFHGFVHNSMDGLVLFEACLSGKLHHVPRRPHDRERSSLIKSGSIFIYEENASGIKRWTDGVAWSPSRILGNFLIYRELEKPFPPGEKKRAMKRKRTSIPGEPYPRRDSDENEAPPEVPTPLTPPTPNTTGEVKPEAAGTDQDKELERSLIGSLVDSYGFRPEGLVKKTMSISVNGISHHMVSYYKVDDVKNNLLPRPLSDPRLQNISVRPELYLKQNFRAPVEETEHYAIDGHMNAHPQMMYSSMAGGYGAPQGQYFQQQQQQGRPYPGMYSMPQSSGGMPYGSMPGQNWPPQQAPPAPMPYGGHQQQHPQHQQQQPYGGQGYGSYYKPEQHSNGSAPKTESQQPASQYGNNQYASAYPAMQQRSGSQSAPSMMQPPYQQAPTQQQQPGSYGTNNGRSAYDSPTTSQQPHSAYGASHSQYAVRSPTSQSYGAPQQTHSPHPGNKSPQSTHQGTPAQSGEQQHNSYRSSYAHGPPTPQSAHPSNGEMNGLGISSNNSSYPPPPPQNGHGHHAYGSTPQAQTAGPYPS